MRKLLASAVFATAVLSSVLLASSALATPASDQTQTVTNQGSTSAICSTGMMAINYAIGSTFTAGVTGNLTSVDIPVMQNAGNADVTVSIYALSNGVPSGQALATETFLGSSLTSIANGGTFSAVFSSPAAVVSGNSYAFSFRFPSCASYAQMVVRVGSTPADKRLVYNQNSNPNWTVDNNYGIAFTTYVEVPQVQSSPSASSSSSVVPSSAPQLAVTSAPNLAGMFGWLSFATLLIGAGSALITQKLRKRLRG